MNENFDKREVSTTFVPNCSPPKSMKRKKNVWESDVFKTVKNNMIMNWNHEDTVPTRPG